MLRRKIPFTAVIQKQEGADAGKNSFENNLEEGGRVQKGLQNKLSRFNSVYDTQKSRKLSSLLRGVPVGL